MICSSDQLHLDKLDWSLKMFPWCNKKGADVDQEENTCCTDPLNYNRKGFTLLLDTLSYSHLETWCSLLKCLFRNNGSSGEHVVTARFPSSVHCVNYVKVSLIKKCQRQQSACPSSSELWCFSCPLLRHSSSFVISNYLESAATPANSFHPCKCKYTCTAIVSYVLYPPNVS